MAHIGRVAESGIRVRLRSVSRKGWEFESPRAHKQKTVSTSETVNGLITRSRRG